MSTAHLQLIAECAAIYEFATGEYLFRAGDGAKGFYLIESGEIGVEGVVGDQPVVIDVARAGEPVGWSWMFEPFIAEYGARALAPTRTIFVDAARLTQHRAADLTLGHELFKRMSEVMVRRLRAARAKLFEAEHRQQHAG